MQNSVEIPEQHRDTKVIKQIKKKKNKTINKTINKTTNKTINKTINTDTINLTTETNDSNVTKPKIILTIDVGLKNLAMCIMDNNYHIHLWDVYNILEEEDINCHGSIKNKPCHYKCHYKYPNENNDVLYSCKTHFPKSMKELKNTYLIKQKKVKDYLLQDITKKIMESIDTIFHNNKEIFDKLTTICIELQPKVNQRMKFTSHIIYAKFVDLYKNYSPIVPIKFIRASQNLQSYKGPVVECKLKSAYAKRKFLSVAYVKWYLESNILNNEFNNNKQLLEKLLTHSKKDDLCDVINSNLNVHYGLTQKQKRNKNGSEIK